MNIVYYQNEEGITVEVGKQKLIMSAEQATELYLCMRGLVQYHCQEAAGDLALAQRKRTIKELLDLASEAIRLAKGVR